MSTIKDSKPSKVKEAKTPKTPAAVASDVTCKACLTHLKGQKTHTKHTCTPKDRIKAAVKLKVDILKPNHKPKGFKNGYETFVQSWRSDYRKKNETKRGFEYEEKAYRKAARLKWDGMTDAARRTYQDTADRNNQLALEKERQAVLDEKKAKGKPKNSEGEKTKAQNGARPKEKKPKISAKDAAILSQYPEA